MAVAIELLRTMPTRMPSFRAWLGERLSRYLSQAHPVNSTAAPTDPVKLMACIRPGDVLLVEGQSRISVGIKYLTQSTWSHAALYVGDVGCQSTDCEARCFIEADVREGVRLVGVQTYQGLHCRIARPVSLTPQETQALVAYALQRLGHQYDLRHVLDLARFLLPTPPVPVRWRRRLLALGSGEPTRAICSTLIAQAFQSVKYPILPTVELVASPDPQCEGCFEELLHIRHHSLFVPRDFDVSPYFAIVKPTLQSGFDHHQLSWKTVEGLGTA